MNQTKEELIKQIKKLEDKKEQLKNELENIYRKEEDDVEERIKLSVKGKGNFTEDELVFAATSRCECGAGMAYPKNIGICGHWDCSDILMGKALLASDENSKRNTGQLPFSFYNIKSETQMIDSKTRYIDKGITTRPQYFHPSQSQEV